MSREEKAQALRAHLSADHPEMFAFMESMKTDFGASVLYVKTDTVEAGVEPQPGISPYAPLPSSTWPYKVGETAAGFYVRDEPKRKRK